jgi:hypothetical protein
VTATSAASAQVSVFKALTAPNAPTTNLATVKPTQKLVVTGHLPSTGATPLAWQWLVSFNGGAYSDATVCAVNSGTTGAHSQTVVCTIAAGTLPAGTYTFELMVTDSATVSESQTSAASRTVTVT